MWTHIYKQPNPFEKFIFRSSFGKKSSLDVEFILCHNILLPKIYIVVDLYSQINPPRLSNHLLLRKDYNPNNKFILHVMDQVNQETSYYKYYLNNCHIQRSKVTHKKGSIKEKLRELKRFELLKPSLSASDKEIINNIIAIDYFDVNKENKVYMGFTPYIYNEVTNCIEKLAETTFTNAIYDSSDFMIPTPNFSKISDGSEHILTVKDCYKIQRPKSIRLRLLDEDQSWKVDIVGRVVKEGIQFTVPPYLGNWNLWDNNRLIDIQILDVIEGLPTTYAIKFAYV